ncbi:glycosyltransferase [Acidiferrobacter sp.]|uniref:glycosyltransferase n=1 Tax=Acidiferrobacter sp. TaxID=1872107 RepID=UPI0026339DCA|nr:glycosyltransferase [Acidiferrobacter sp.]
MRVLMVSDTYFPRISGVASSIRSFRAGLARLGHEVDLIVPRYGVDDMNEPGVFHADAWRIPLYPEERIMAPGKHAFWEQCGKTLGYDVIHIQTPFVAHIYGLRLARKWGIPVAVSYHTHFEAYIGHYYPWLSRTGGRAMVRAISRRQCQSADVIIAPSTAMARVLGSYGVRTRIDVIPTGIDMSSSYGGDGSDFRIRNGINLTRPIILYAGRLAPEKNIPFLLEVTARLRTAIPDILMLMAGDGPARPALEAFVHEHHLTDAVRFLGYVDRDTTLKEIYRAADLFVFASQTETQGMVLLEALAAGLPIVAISALGVADLLASHQGTCSSKADPDKFSAACLEILKNPALHARMATEAVQHAMRLSQDAMSRRLGETYAGLVGVADAIRGVA